MRAKIRIIIGTSMKSTTSNTLDAKPWTMLMTTAGALQTQFSQ